MDFRKIFVVEPVHDTSVFKKYTSNIVFLLRGDERVEDMQEKIKINLADFDPNQDAMISMGRTTSCLISGSELHKLLGEGSFFSLGIFQGEGEYTFIEVNT